VIAGAITMITGAITMITGAITMIANAITPAHVLRPDGHAAARRAGVAAAG
jgi:hypothetical protein